MKRKICGSADAFKRLVNMTPAEIRRWARDPRAKCFSKESTRRRLESLARLRAKPPGQWTAKDCAFAARVVSFNSRMLGAMERDGCTPGYAVSLRNWGHAPRCAVPASCTPSKVARGGVGNATAAKAAKRRKDRARRLRDVETVRTMVEVPASLPAHIEPTAAYLLERGGRVPSLREAIKAYAITRSSVQRSSAAGSSVCRYYPELAKIQDVSGDVRPEDVFAHLLFEPYGQRYLAAAERGRFDRQAAWQLASRMGCWGLTDTLMQDLRYAAEGLPKLYPRLVELYTQDDPTAWTRFVQKDVYNVSAAKAGFLRALLGKGDVPTFDAREINLWMTNPREVSPEDVAVLTERLERWPIALPAELEPHRQHLVHHAIWDATEGTRTTHEESLRAMRLASLRGRQR